MNEILAALKGAISKHGEAVVIAAALVIGGRSYLAEHDARLRADAAARTAQTQIMDLEKQQATIRKQAAAKVVVLQQKAAEVKTVPEAVKALQSDAQVKTALPSLTQLPDAPDQLKVNTLELFKGVNKCEQDAVQLDACTKTLDLQKQITTQKEVEITALKKKPSFWHRLGKAAKIIGCAGAGAAIGGLTKSASGAAIGGAAGAGICQAF